MSKKNKVLLTVLVVGLGGTLAGFGVFSAFSSTTSNPGNTFQAGSVTIGDNDGDAALFNTSTLHGNAEPGTYDRCIRVTYSGTLDADVKLYTDAITGDGNDMTMTVHKSPDGVDPDCSDFGAATQVFAAAPMTTFDNHADWASGLAVNPGAATKWVTSDAVTFRFRITVGDGDQDKTVDSFDLTWEAQNQ